MNFGFVADFVQEISHTYQLWPFPGCYLHQRVGSASPDLTRTAAMILITSPESS